MTEQVESLSEILSADTTFVDAGADHNAPEAEQRARDEIGRFVPKTNEPEPVAAPALTEPTQAQPEARPDGLVPQQALHAERQKNRDLETQMAELRGRLDAFMAQPKPTPAQQQEQPKPKRELWDDPDGFVADRLTPFQQQQVELNARLSHVSAVQEFGKEAVTAAYQAMNAAVEARTLDRNVVNGQLEKSRDPVGDIIRWHKGQTAKANMDRIGNDPDAWLNAEIEKKLADPAFQAQVIEKARAAAQQPGRSPAPTTLPTTLTRLPGGSGNRDDGVPSLGEILKGG